MSLSWRIDLFMDQQSRAWIKTCVSLLWSPVHRFLQPTDMPFLLDKVLFGFLNHGRRNICFREWHESPLLSIEISFSWIMIQEIVATNHRSSQSCVIYANCALSRIRDPENTSGGKQPFDLGGWLFANASSLTPSLYMIPFVSWRCTPCLWTWS